MAVGSVQPGDAFVIDPSGGLIAHLWVVIYVWVPDYAYTEHAVIVNITTVTKFADRTCLLSPTDDDAHEFVKHPSYVFYAEAQDVEVTELLGLGADKRRAPVCAALLARMRDGLHRSPYVKRGLKAVVPR